MSKQPAWADSPIRRLVAVCPDCSDLVDMVQRCHFKYRNGHLMAEVLVEPVAHVCDQESYEEAA